MNKGGFTVCHIYFLFINLRKMQYMKSNILGNVLASFSGIRTKS